MAGVCIRLLSPVHHSQYDSPFPKSSTWTRQRELLETSAGAVRGGKVSGEMVRVGIKEGMSKGEKAGQENLPACRTLSWDPEG